MAELDRRAFIKRVGGLAAGLVAGGAFADAGDAKTDKKNILKRPPNQSCGPSNAVKPFTPIPTKKPEPPMCPIPKQNNDPLTS